MAIPKIRDSKRIKKEFIEGATEKDEPSSIELASQPEPLLSEIATLPENIEDLSFTELKKLSNADLIKRLIDIDKQYYIMVSRILWTLRQRFESDQKFGIYLKATLPEWVSEISSTQRNRFVNLGAFIARHKIKDLKKEGIALTGFYKLAEQKPEIADVVYKEVRKKSLPVSDIENLLKEEKNKHKRVVVNDFELSELKNPDTGKESHLPGDSSIDVQISIDENNMLDSLVAEKDSNVIKQAVHNLLEGYGLTREEKIILLHEVLADFEN
jgi:hypothetical protein